MSSRKKMSMTDTLVIASVFIAVCGIGVFLAVDGLDRVPVNPLPQLPIPKLPNTKTDTVKTPVVKFNADSLKDSVRLMK